MYDRSVTVIEVMIAVNMFSLKAIECANGIFDTTQPIRVKINEPGGGAMPRVAAAKEYLELSHQENVLKAVR
jgi:hypothetical protein